MSRLALGTVQFGMSYGISNTSGQVSQDEVAKILDYCKSSGIDTLDTAQGYGESERVLGMFDISPFKIVTKLMGNARLEDSLERLRVQSVYGLMFHRENECNDETWKLFESYKAQGLAKKIGVSVYTSEALDSLVEKYPVEIVQFPMNILDQSFVPLLPSLKEKGIEVHTRSAFLQGLLLMDRIPEYFAPVRDKIESIPKPRLDYALDFCRKQEQVDRTVLGVTCLRDLQEIVWAYSCGVPEETDYSSYAVNDERYINPSLWQVKQ